MSLKIMPNTVLLLTSTSRLRITDVSALHVGGGGVQQQKRLRTSYDFPCGMIFFDTCFRNFVNQIWQKGQKRTEKKKNIKKVKAHHDLF